MAFAAPKFSRSEINRAGEILSKSSSSRQEAEHATEVLSNWRASHLYPINTFQSTLRQRARRIESQFLVAQRLKRTPSIVSKLQRFLTQMQDIGGLRAVLSTVENVRKLQELYCNPELHRHTFKHILERPTDYIDKPKADGYRSVHLVFRYNKADKPEYNKLLVELQFRTRLQHAWATAVETMGIISGQALKSGQGEERAKKFFLAASAAFAHIEHTAPVPGFENFSKQETFIQVAKESNSGVLETLRGFALAARVILQQPRQQGEYNLIVLDPIEQSVAISSFSRARLEEANAEYAKVEERALRGEKIEAVLVSAGPLDDLQKAYPNYFLDTHAFVDQIKKIINNANK